MKLFVTGATGFIGKNLVNELIKQKHLITINLLYNEASPFPKEVNIHRLNESNMKEDSQFLKQEKFNGLLHLASLYLKSHKPEEVVNLIDSNVRFSTYILQCAVQAKIPWFINTGTFWQHYQNKEYSPVNLYAATKEAFECIAKYYIETNMIKFCTIKLSDTYGPKDTRPKIFNLWENIAKTYETLDMSLGEQVIDMSHVDDVVGAFIRLTKLLQTNNSFITNGSCFSVKADKRFSLVELAVIFERITGYKLNIKWGKLAYREREVMVPWEDGENVPGWEPKISILEGLKKLFFKF